MGTTAYKGMMIGARVHLPVHKPVRVRSYTGYLFCKNKHQHNRITRDLKPDQPIPTHKDWSYCPQCGRHLQKHFDVQIATKQERLDGCWEALHCLLQQRGMSEDAAVAFEEDNQDWWVPLGPWDRPVMLVGLNLREQEIGRGRNTKASYTVLGDVVGADDKLARVVQFFADMGVPELEPKLLQYVRVW